MAKPLTTVRPLDLAPDQQQGPGDDDEGQVRLSPSEIKGLTPRQVADLYRQRQLAIDYGTQDVTKAAQILALEAIDVLGTMMRNPTLKPAVRADCAKTIILHAIGRPGARRDVSPEDLPDEEIERLGEAIIARRAKRLKS